MTDGRHTHEQAAILALADRLAALEELVSDLISDNKRLRKLMEARAHCVTPRRLTATLSLTGGAR